MDKEVASDIHAFITAQIAAAIEAGVDAWRMPWRTSEGALVRPRNVASGRAYQGVNILSLWISAERGGFATPVWGTFRQWRDKGAQVRKGEKGAPIVFYKELEFARDEDGSGNGGARVRYARASYVFNVAQVEGYKCEAAPERPAHDEIGAKRDAEILIAATQADIREGGARAYYHRGGDYIVLPDRHLFMGSATSSPADAWYATQLHELTHWTGAQHRLDRNLANRFGSEAYAIEELIAELGSAFLCADLGLAAAPRPDHAAYVSTWLRVLKNDRRAIFTASSQADRAVRFLLELRPSGSSRTGADAPPDP